MNMSQKNIFKSRILTPKQKGCVDMKKIISNLLSSGFTKSGYYDGEDVDIR